MKESTANFIRHVVTKNGKQYIPALLPEDIERGRPGDCFDHCAVQVYKNRHYKYVEGIASNPEDPEEFIYHAWITDGTHAFDPTWQANDDSFKEHPIPSTYIGIEVEILELVRFLTKVGYKGILANHWRNPELFEDIMKVTVKR